MKIDSKIVGGLFVGILMSLPVFANAQFANYWYPAGNPSNLRPVSGSWGVQADHFTATSTTATSTFVNASTTNLTVSGNLNANGSLLTNLNASNISSGYMPIGRLAGGNSGQVVVTSGLGLSSWGQLNLGSTAGLTGTLGVSNGGTGLTSLSTGYIPFGNGTSAFSSSLNGTLDTSGNLGIGNKITLGSSGSRLITTAGGGTLTLSQTGAKYGNSSLIIENTDGVNGVMFSTAGNTAGYLADEVFNTGFGVTQNLRLEQRTNALLDPANDSANGGQGAFQFLNNNGYAWTGEFGKYGIILNAPTGIQNAGSINSMQPKSMLDVSGNVSLGSYAGNNAAPANGLIVSGNVGIGTTSPDTALDVNGTVKFEGTSAFTTSSISGPITGIGCDTAVTTGLTGLASTTTFVTTPKNYPGAGIWFYTLALTSTSAITYVCSDVTVTPTASTYNVRIIN